MGIVLVDRPRERIQPTKLHHGEEQETHSHRRGDNPAEGGVDEILRLEATDSRWQMRSPSAVGLKVGLMPNITL